MTQKPKKLVFAPGCFDEFEGTQDELDQLVEDIKKAFSGSIDDILANSVPVDFDTLIEDDPELASTLLERLEDLNDTTSSKRTLN